MMCRRMMRSLFCGEDLLGLIKNLVQKVLTQSPRRGRLDRSVPQDRLQLLLNPEEIEEALAPRVRELDQHVHVAVRPEVIAQD